MFNSSQSATDPDTKDSLLSKRSSDQKDTDHEMLIDEMCQEELGFSIIIKKLVDKKVPLAGSNSMIDLCFMYH